jgi:DUF2924 family protein
MSQMGHTETHALLGLGRHWYGSQTSGRRGSGFACRSFRLRWGRIPSCIEQCHAWLRRARPTPEGKGSLRDLHRKSSEEGLVPMTGATLVRQWRGRGHTVLVREDGFEYEGQHYRSLSVIAERITGAHWSGPRFFGLTKRTGASVGAEAGQ